jgi:hypothetical protein
VLGVSVYKHILLFSFLYFLGLVLLIIQICTDINTNLYKCMAQELIWAADINPKPKSLVFCHLKCDYWMYFGIIILSTDLDRGTKSDPFQQDFQSVRMGARVKFSTNFSLSD